MQVGSIVPLGERQQEPKEVDDVMVISCSEYLRLQEELAELRRRARPLAAGRMNEHDCILAIQMLAWAREQAGKPCKVCTHRREQWYRKSVSISCRLSVDGCCQPCAAEIINRAAAKLSDCD